MKAAPLRVLLIEDDPDDYSMTRRLLSKIKTAEFDLEWAQTFEEGLGAMQRKEHDVYLIDYRLGRRDGLDLLQAAMASSCTAPAIMLTGQGGYEVDAKAMELGAADYLAKDGLDSALLERAIRYSMERQRAKEALKQSERDYRGLFENAHDAIIIFDPEDEIVLDANRRACEMYGIGRAEFIGMRLDRVSKTECSSQGHVPETLPTTVPYQFETIQVSRMPRRTMRTGIQATTHRPLMARAAVPAC